MEEVIRVNETRLCLMCKEEGMPLYLHLQDCLFGVLGVWNLVRCLKCGLVWLNPPPVPEDIGKLYEHYCTHNIPLSQTTDKNLVYRLLKNVLGKFYCLIGLSQEMAELDLMTLKEDNKGRILDVGCGNGQFLAKMRELGWSVMGVEPDGKAVKIARELFGLNVYEGSLEDAGFLDDFFDAITMSHVLEHLWNPVGTFEECYRVLKPGGKLVIVTPNIQSLGHRIFREAWRGLDVPRHLYFFSPHTLRTCAEQAGFKIMKLWTTARIAPWMWVVSRFIRRDGALPGGSPQKLSWRLRLEGLAFQLVEYEVSRIRDAGEKTVMMAMK